MNESFVHDDHLLVTPEEAARRLSLGRTTVYELMATGELESVRIGRSRRIPVSSLVSFVAGLVHTTPHGDPLSRDWPDLAARRAGCRISVQH